MYNTLHAQNLNTTLSAPFPYFRSEFTKQSITWNWQNQFFIADTIGENWHWDAQDLYRSNLIMPSGAGKQWKDEHNFSGNFRLDNPYISPGLYIKSWLLSDKQISADNRNQFGTHAMGLIFKSNFINPYVGYQQSRNRELVEWGWDTGIGTNLKNIRYNNYSTNLNADSHYDFYETRQNYDNKINMSVQTTFSKWSGDSISFSFSESSKQYYSNGKLEKIKIYNRNWKNRLFYFLTYRDLISISTHISSRDISFFNGRNIFHLENRLNYIHTGNDLNYTISMNTHDETQDNAGIRTDSRSRQTVLNLNLDYSLNSKQNIAIDFAYGKMQYDTPDTIVNNDDRDEQRFVVSADYYHIFSPVLKMSWKAYAYFFHQMYIYSERSINNNWNRVFKLNPQVDYAYGRVRNSLSTQVLANYTVFDFEELFNQTRSYIFRKYTLSDSMSIRVIGSNYVGTTLKIEKEDKGNFFEKGFLQQLLQSYQSEFYNIFWRNNHFFYFRLMAGYTFYYRDEWRYLPKKERIRKISNSGPFVSVQYKTAQRLVFFANAALSFLDDSVYRRTEYFTGSIRLYYTL